MLNIFEQPWTLIALSIVFFFILQIIRQCETNWWISNLLIILFLLGLALNRFYGVLSPKNKYIVPLFIIILLIYEAVLIGRAIWIDKNLWWLWIVPIVIAIIGFGLDAFVKTDMELIRDLIHTGASAFEDEKPAQIQALVAEDYHDSYHRSKDSLMDHCRNILSQPLIERIVPRIVSFTLESPTAQLICVSQISFDRTSYASQYYNQGMLVTTQIELRKQANNQWFINSLEITQINMYPASWSDIR
jgi:hypothetical protein